jgi:serine/threonine-protein kinase
LEEVTEEETVALEERAMPASPVVPDVEPPTDTSSSVALHSRETSLKTSRSAVATPQEAMRQDEIRRMRFFTAFAGTLATLACALAYLLPGNPLARDIHFVGAALTAIMGFTLAVVLRNDSNYRVWMGTSFGLVATAATSAGFYFWGVNSAIILVIPIGTFFFALGESYTGALLIHAVACIAHGLISALQILGVIPEVGMIKAETFNDTHRWGILLALQIIYLGAFVMARALRRSSMETLERLDGAVREVAQREALLEEAKDDLARALKVGGPGRFTGQVLGSYRLGTILGRGGMGDVYGATHVETEELAAVKMLNREGMTNSSLVARFYRELEITRSIRGENIVRVLEFPEPDAPIPYLAMERLHGKTLGDLLRVRPSLGMKEMLYLMRALTTGIGAAHAQGIVHRDLKPKNLLAHKQGSKTVWKILDFGVSKLLDQSGTLTQGKVIGTPSYMAPEQAAGEEVDARADLYSIGVILYRVLTGRRAFLGASIPALLRAVHADMPPQPSKIAELSHEIDCVLAIAMAKKPEDRFGTAEELAAAVEQAAKESLDEEIRLRGEALMESYPWGKRNAF